jgi:hypothetical protein
MELNTAEKFLLIIMHPEKPRYLIPETKINPGLFGAMLMDLSLEEKIEFKDKRIIAHSSYTKISEAHNILLSKISASKKRKRIKTWITAFAWNSRKYRHMILRDLVLKGKVRIEERSFLFIPFKSAFLIDKNIKKQIQNEISDVLLNKKPPEDDIACLLGIIDGCKAYKLITKDKESLKSIKHNIKEMVQNDSVSKEVQKVIQEMQAASIVATTTATSG